MLTLFTESVRKETGGAEEEMEKGWKVQDKTY